MGDVATVQILMPHPMETGLRNDAAGRPVPAHHITDVKAMLGTRTVLEAKWGPAISQNPFLHFRFSGGKVGDKVTVTWADNQGDKRTDEAAIV